MGTFRGFLAFSLLAMPLQIGAAAVVNDDRVDITHELQVCPVPAGKSLTFSKPTTLYVRVPGKNIEFKVLASRVSLSPTSVAWPLTMEYDEIKNETLIIFATQTVAAVYEFQVFSTRGDHFKRCIVIDTTEKLGGAVGVGNGGDRPETLSAQTAEDISELPGAPAENGGGGGFMNCKYAVGSDRVDLQPFWAAILSLGFVFLFRRRLHQRK